MSFIVLFSQATIPLFCAGFITIFHRKRLAFIIAASLVLASLWQMSIAVLYGGQWFSVHAIEILFKLFRIGTLFEMPLVYYFGWFLYNLNKPVISLKPSYKWLSIIYSKPVFFILFSYSTIVYIFNFTTFDIAKLTVVTESIGSHYYPIYGPFNPFFAFNSILIIVHCILLLTVNRFTSHSSYKKFFIFISTVVAIVWVNSFIAAYMIIPLFFSCFSNIVLWVLVFSGYLLFQDLNNKGIHLQVAEQKEMLQKMMDLNPNYMFVANNHSEIIMANQSLYKLFNLEVYQNGKLSSLLFPGELVEPSDEINYKGRKKSTLIEWTRVEFENGEETTNKIYFGIDVTERKKEQESLIKAEKLRVLGELAAGVAHEIRNPFTSIKGFIQLLKEENPLDNHKKYLDIISSEIDRVNDVLNELLYLAKPEAHTDKEGLMYPIDQLLQDVKLLFERSAFLYQGTIEIKIEKEFYMSSALVNRIKQIVINLVKNSLEALGETGLVRISAGKTENGMAEIKIADNGTGISKERLSHIGEPFYTTKEKGTGLGLTISAKIARELGGDLIIKSKKNVGTIILVTFNLK